MKAVSNEVLSTIKALQKLPSLQEAMLGGGTSLALRFDHRESVDIDLLFSGIIGRSGYKKIENEVRALFAEAILMLEYPCNIDDQFIFLRFLVRVNDEQIKVEIIQNMIFTEDAEIVKEIKVLSLKDIGMLKLMAVANRANYKDVYDLYYLTEKISLQTLFDLLKEKQNNYPRIEHQSIFDLDGEVSPIKEPKRLLNFEETSKINTNRPRHSTSKFRIANGTNWQVAQTRWRQRVKELILKLEAK